MRGDRGRLDDILEAADKVAERVQRGKDRFDADEDTRFAIIHLIEIIGEAASRVSVQLRDKYRTCPGVAPSVCGTELYTATASPISRLCRLRPRLGLNRCNLEIVIRRRLAGMQHHRGLRRTLAGELATIG